MPWQVFQKPAPEAPAGRRPPQAASFEPAPEPAAPHPKVYVWGESADRCHQLAGLFPRESWAFVPTFQTGALLVSLLRSNRPAAIVFHYREGEDKIIETLQSLEKECPECPRLVVCAEDCQESLRSWKGLPPTILTDHATPADSEEKLRRAITLNQWLMQPAIRSVLPRLRTVPSLPVSHQRVVEVLRNPNFAVDEVARLIAHDLALTTNLFKAVNSAALGLGHPVNSVPEAITMLGVSRLQALVMSAWAFSFIDDRTCEGFSPSQEWEHAATVAAAAQAMARELELPAVVAEAAFTAGMLHDLGKLLLAANAANAYELSLADARESQRPLWEIENEGMGFSHAEIGGCMLAIWGMSPPVVEAVAWHHQPARASIQELSPLTLVHLANCRACGLEPDPAQVKLVATA